MYDLGHQETSSFSSFATFQVKCFSGKDITNYKFSVPPHENRWIKKTGNMESKATSHETQGESMKNSHQYKPKKTNTSITSHLAWYLHSRTGSVFYLRKKTQQLGKKSLLNRVQRKKLGILGCVKMEHHKFSIHQNDCLWTWDERIFEIILPTSEVT